METNCCLPVVKRWKSVYYFFSSCLARLWAWTRASARPIPIALLLLFLISSRLRGCFLLHLYLILIYSSTADCRLLNLHEPRGAEFFATYRRSQFALSMGALVLPLSLPTERSYLYAVDTCNPRKPFPQRVIMAAGRNEKNIEKSPNPLTIATNHDAPWTNCWRCNRRHSRAKHIYT